MSVFQPKCYVQLLSIARTFWRICPHEREVKRFKIVRKNMMRAMATGWSMLVPFLCLPMQILYY